MKTLNLKVILCVVALLCALRGAALAQMPMTEGEFAIKGRVIDDATGKPVTKFKVYLDFAGAGANSPGGREFNDADGKFTLFSGTHSSGDRVIVFAEGYATALILGHDMVPAAEAMPFDLRMQKGRRVEVRVVDAGTSAPLAGAAVADAWLGPVTGTIAYAGPHYWFSSMAKSPEVNRVDDLKTDAAGRVEFVEGDLPGVLFIAHEDYMGVPIEPNQRYIYQEAPNRLVVRMDRGVTVEGVFKDFDGTPAAGLIAHLNMGSVGGGNFLRTDEQGRFTMKAVKSGGGTIDFDTMENQRTTSGFNMRVMIGAEPHQTINIGDDLGPCSLSGRILRDDAPVAGAIVFLNNKFGWKYENIHETSGADGAYAFVGLKAGEYEVSVNESSRGNGGRRYQRIAVNGGARQDFAFGGESETTGGRHKVSARLVFPEGAEEFMLRRYTRIILAYASEDRNDLKDGLDTYVELNKAGDRWEGTACLVGDYRLQLGNNGNWRQPNIASTEILHLNTSEKDQDLGDVPVPKAGRIRAELAFERAEDAQLLELVGLQALDYKDREKYKGSGLSNSAQVPMLAGGLDVAGRFQGDYWLTLSPPARDFMPTPLRRFGPFHIADAGADTDLGTIAIPPIRRVRATLLFEEAAVKAGTYSAWLTRVVDARNGVSDIGAAERVNCPIDANGGIEFAGLFAGKYRLHLSDYADQESATGYTLPQLLNLDNEAADQDLGDIRIGRQAYVRVDVRMSGSASMWEYIRVYRDADRDPLTVRPFSLKCAPGLQRLGPVAEGPLHLEFDMPGFAIEPAAADVMVVADKNKEAAVTLDIRRTETPKTEAIAKGL